MDPVGAAASILTIVDAIRTGIKTAVRLYEAPVELDALQKEVDTFNHVLRETVAVSTVSRNTHGHLATAIPTTQECLLEIQQIIQYELIKDAPDGAKARRIAWLRKADQVSRLQEKLGRCKSTLLLAYNCETLVTVRRSEAQLQELQRTLRHQTADIDQSLRDYRNDHKLALENIRYENDKRWESQRTLLEAQQRQNDELEAKLSLLIEGFKQPGQLEWEAKGKEILAVGHSGPQLRLPGTSSDWSTSSRIASTPMVTKRMLASTSDRSSPESKLRHLASSMKTQLHKCHNDHPRCGSMLSDAQDLPKRLIYTGSGRDDIRLYEPKAGETARYTTLSYTWGRAAPTVTTKSSLPARLTNIAWDVLPALIQDAIVFSRSLEIAFIWIDSLCIIQDDNEDWAQESVKMAEIYGNSVLTLAAVSAPDPTHGLLPSQDALAMRLDSDGAQRNSVSRVLGLDHDVARPHHGGRKTRSAWHTRAWTLQEEILSPRTVLFGTGQVKFRCSSDLVACSVHGEAPESSMLAIGDAENDLGLRRMRNEVSQSDGPASNIWQSVIDEYSTRQMSFSMDKLVAISGVAKMVAEKTYDTYLAGHWRSSLVSSLGWHTSFSGRRQDEYVAPSWSWASWDGPVSMVDISTKVPHAELVHHDVKPIRQKDNYGAVSSGSITLKGLCIDAILEDSETITHDLESDKSDVLLNASKQYLDHAINKRTEDSSLTHGQRQLLIHLRCGKLRLTTEADNFEEFAQGLTVKLMKISADKTGEVWTALILLQCDGVNHQNYRRIAVMELYRRRGEQRWFDAAIERQITII